VIEPSTDSILKTYQIKIEEESYVESLKFIIDESKKKGIELYIIRLPQYKANLAGLNELLLEMIEDKATLIDLSSAIKEKKFFFDNGHLNELGAAKFSKSIPNYIN
jgi:hypothetical protein